MRISTSNIDVNFVLHRIPPHLFCAILLGRPPACLASICCIRRYGTASLNRPNANYNPPLLLLSPCIVTPSFESLSISTTESRPVLVRFSQPSQMQKLLLLKDIILQDLNACPLSRELGRGHVLQHRSTLMILLSLGPEVLG